MGFSLNAFFLCLIWFILYVAKIRSADHHDDTDLKYGFYDKICPSAENIVRSTVSDYVAQDVTVAAPVLRLHFHDCFVRGCDGSVLLNSTKNNKAEKDAKPNLTLDGFYVIDAAKTALEKACPGVVSCADIVALAARDAVYLSSGAHYEAQTGRRDGVESHASEAAAKIPDAFSGFEELKANFAATGLNVKDLAVLSGAHTIGQSHCQSFSKRIYNFTGKGDVDPTLDPTYIPILRKQCKPGDTTTTVDMVPGGSTTFDTDYYNLVTKKRGLFHSDAALLSNKETRAYVYSHTSDKSAFFKDFGVSMVKMGRHAVLTGKDGDIRKNCALLN